MELDELIGMAHMWAITCSRQYEKYIGFQYKGYTWAWEDCEAAYWLIIELPNWFELVDKWQKEHICRDCGFPIEHHAYRCKSGGAYWLE